jgi:DnaJ-class molecular chaperone
MEKEDVISPIQVPLEIMLKGGELETLTMYGSKTVFIPPGTQPHARVRVGKYGVQRQGFHYCVVEPIFPTTEDLKSGKWTELKIDWNLAESKRQKEDNEIENLFNQIRGFTITINEG